MDKEKLDQYWEAFKSQLKDAGKSTEVAILNQPYSLPKENIIELQINSVLQEDILERFKIELLGYLRENCDNPAIKLQTKMVKEDHDKKLYTSQDKLNYLAENNPNVLDLQRRLGLDIDF